ncbi:proteasomal ubiquitin receptor ADRM1 homolog [Drosophila tropicalis]|uniref:proteasomal ubiquitin receptor ADRM1 homolog n=1 Tax=Drosophila tropicalis TaxID=46794 RepID=UPI0035ABCA2C
MSDQSENLIEYKAGRMNMVGKRIEPEERRGLIYLRRYIKDNQIHFCWVDRKTGHIEVDIVAEPGLLQFRRIEQCKTGRIYVLKFKQSTRRLFFWLQEQHHENDEEFCIRMNEYLLGPHVDGTIDPSKPLASDTNRRSGGGGNDISTEDQYIFDEGRYIFEQKDEIMELWTTPRDGQVTSEDSKDNNQASCLPSLAQPTELVDSTIIESSFIDLGLALQMHGETAVSTLVKSKLRMRALLAQLPQDDDDIAVKEQEQMLNDLNGSSLYIEEHLRSPQFYEAFAQFSIGLEAGVLGPVLEPFHLDAEAMAAVRLGDLELFLRVLHQDIKNEQQQWS